MGTVGKVTNYLKRNGIKETVYASMERLLWTKGVPYNYADIGIQEKKRQRDWAMQQEKPVLFSILVPVYETPKTFLKEMIDSCLEQTYPFFELILADASVTDSPRQIIETYSDNRVKYLKLSENKGISYNTNKALDEAQGEYCALLDHDDVITPDALYEMAYAVSNAQDCGIELKLLYSDEDKTDTYATKYYEPHLKLDFNLDLLLSNNYICHFTVIKTEILKDVRFREGYDGSQDHDLFLRSVGRILFENGKLDVSKAKEIFHINKVLYHWRCHEASTAFNPASKEYAYVAGERAITDFVNEHYGEMPVTGLAHKGFYKIDWGNDFFEQRPEIGAVGGVIYSKNKISSGIIEKENEIESYIGINKHFSGYMQRLKLQHSVFALDIRSITPAPDLRDAYDAIVSELSSNSGKTENMAAGVEFGKLLREKNRLLLYEPKLNQDLTDLEKKW